VAFHAQHSDRDPFAHWGFNDERFAWVAGEDTRSKKAQKQHTDRRKQALIHTS